MKAAFYAGAAGLIAQQSAIDAIGNNLSNISTNGYKPEEYSFQSLLYTDMYANTDTNPLTSTGARAVSTGLDFTDGSYQPTGYALDFAVNGTGMFAVAKDNVVSYTRDGEFSVSMENGIPYLVNATGAYVLNQNLQKLTVPYQADGSVDAATLRSQLGLFTFANREALEPTSANTYKPTARSGAAQSAAGTSTVLSGVIEGSGAIMVDEMAAMIRAQRSYQMAAKVLQTADEDEQTINNLRR